EWESRGRSGPKRARHISERGAGSQRAGGLCYAFRLPRAALPSSMAKPRTMPGVLELLPLEQAAFQGMLDTIRRNFERYGFLGIETPAIEYSDVLLTKSGGETE